MHIPALLPNPSFLFARSVALIRDCPPDPHAPFLYLGEELNLGVRLYTRGWDLFLPNRCPLRVCYDPRHRTSEIAEDRRSGRLLYADRHDHGRGPPDDVARRESLNLQSQRRVLQLVGSPDPDSATSNREDAVVLEGQWGVGETRQVERYLREHLDVDFEEREVSVRARSAGLPAGAALWSYGNNGENNNNDKKSQGGGIIMSRMEDLEWGAGVVARDGLPLRWRAGASTAIDNHLAVGPHEGV